MSAIPTNCCIAHDSNLAAATSNGVCATLTQMYPEGAQLVQGGQPVSWGGHLRFSEFAPTQALTALAAQRPIPTKNAVDGTSSVPTVLKVSTMKLCKQHTNGQCNLGAMCRNIHVCRHSGSNGSAKPARCESASRGGLKLPPLAAASVSSSISMCMRVSPATISLPQLGLAACVGVAPVQSCTSPVKSARSARLAGVDASSFRPTPPGTRMSFDTATAAAADDEDVVLVSTPVPTPPPRSPAPAASVAAKVSTGSGCFRRFAKRWNEPLKTGSGALASRSSVTPSVTPSATNSIDLESVQNNVNVLAMNEELNANANGPMPPTNSSGEGRCYARRSAFDAKDGCFAVFSN